jgi:PAS domain S-box-containing protein
MILTVDSFGHGSERLNAQLLVDSIPALIHTAWPDGYLDYFNKPWLEYLGVTLDKVTGWNWTAFVHPEDVEGIVAKWRACLATGEIFEYETRVRRANGEYRWMFHRKVPLRDANGNIVKWYGSSLDIEERKQAEEKLRRSERDLHSIIETIPTMVWSAAPDGSVDFFNPRWLDCTGLSPDKSRGWRWTAAIHPDDLIRLTDAWRSILVSGEPGETEARLRRFDGAYRWFLFRANALRDEFGKIVKWYGTNVDIEKGSVLPTWEAGPSIPTASTIGLPNYFGCTDSIRPANRLVFRNTWIVSTNMIANPWQTSSTESWPNLRPSMLQNASFVPTVRSGTFAASVLLLSKPKA